MKSSRTALWLLLLAALAVTTTAFASNDAAGKSRLEQSGAQTDYFLLAQGGAGNACLSACQGKYKSCLAPVDPACNSRGCANEKNACAMQYDECNKSCPAR